MAEKYWVAEKKSVWASCNWKIVKSATWYIEVPSGWRPVMICSPLRPPHTGHWLLRRGRIERGSRDVPLLLFKWGQF